MQPKTNDKLYDLIVDLQNQVHELKEYIRQIDKRTISMVRLGDYAR